ncbi:MAG: rhodanese-like domain-containing protein [Nocardioides sp.]|nr:rhodanese-like domain-containing protein [Nocardioides sp.]
MDANAVFSQRDQLQILDVREDGEWAAGRIEGAVHIPRGQLTSRMTELDPAVPVVTVCRSGARSSQAARLLHDRGRPAHDLEGGMTAWAPAGFPVITPAGPVGRVLDTPQILCFIPYPVRKVQHEYRHPDHRDVQPG